MSVHLTEEEQIEALKRWWKAYGVTTVVAIAIAGAGFFGWNQYKSHLVEKASEGSVRYQQFLLEVEKLEEDPDSESAQVRMQALGSDLLNDYSDSLYADFVRLHNARQAVNQGDLARARTLLEEVGNKSADESIKQLAQLRLARVMVAQGEIEPALSILQRVPSDAYAAMYAEARGDVLFMQNRLAEARTAYESALQSMQDPVSIQRNLVQMKIDNTLTAADAESGQSPEPAGVDAENPDESEVSGEA